SQVPMAERLRGSRYRVCGRVAHTGRSVWVIDFGIMAYENREPPRFAARGGWVEGELYLGIDPFFYFEELHKRPGMPALQYRWRLKTIWLETTPWLTRKDGAGSIVTRDERNKSFVEVAET